MQNTAQTVYYYLLQNSNVTLAQIVKATQLTTAQANSALQTLQLRKLAVAYKQKTVVSTYSAVVAHNVKFKNYVRKAKATAVVAQTQQQKNIAQYATQMLKSMLNKFKHYA